MFKSFIVLLLYLPLMVANLSSDTRVRRQSPFGGGVQPPKHLYEPRRVLPTYAHRKAEPHVFPLSTHSSRSTDLFRLSRNYMIVGPKLIRPADIVSVWVTILNDQWPLTHVAVSLFSKHDELASSEEKLLPRIPTAITFQVPHNARNSSYKMYIRRTLPDDHVVFYNETDVIFHPKSLSIFIQLDRPMYRHEQAGRTIDERKRSIVIDTFSEFPLHSRVFGSARLFWYDDSSCYCETLPS